MTPAGAATSCAPAVNRRLQLDDPLIAALHRRDFEIAVESNGTLPMLAGVDWICISPKAGTTAGADHR